MQSGLCRSGGLFVPAAFRRRLNQEAARTLSSWQLEAQYLGWCDLTPEHFINACGSVSSVIWSNPYSKQAILYMHGFLLVLPDDFDENEWEVTAKGWFGEARLLVSGTRYSLNFYDPVRLCQEVKSQMERDAAFFEPNLLVVQSVNKLEMQRAAEMLVQSGQLTALVPD